MGHTLCHNNCQIAFHRLVFGHSLELRHGALQHCVQLQLEQHRSLGQFPRLAPLRMQLAHVANQLAVHQHTGAAARVHRRVGTRLEGGAVAAGEKSLAVRLTLGRDEASLTEAEIEAAVQAVVTQLVARTGGRLRV